jgi:hypothetical protein
MQYNVKWSKGFTGGFFAYNFSSEQEAINRAIYDAKNKHGIDLTESDIEKVTKGPWSNGHMTMWS